MTFTRHSAQASEVGSARNELGGHPGRDHPRHRILKPFGVYVDRRLATRKWDVDGHEYIDY